MSSPTPYIDITREGETLTVELTDYTVVPGDSTVGEYPDITDIIAARSDNGEIVELTRAEDKEAAAAIFDFLAAEKSEADTERRIEARNDRRA